MYTNVDAIIIESSIDTTKLDSPTLAQLRSELFTLAGVVTKRIETMLVALESGFSFEPLYDTKFITPTPTNTNRYLGKLVLDAYLLEVKTLTNNGMAIAQGTDFLSYPQNVWPIRELRLMSPVRSSWYPLTCPPGYQGGPILESIVIEGWWGYRERYQVEGWIDSGDVVLTSGLIDEAYSTITVHDPNGATTWGDAPRFSEGMLIRIDDEMMLIRAKDETAKTISVRRGQRGTTITTHAVNSMIKTWNPAEDIARVATRQAGMLYARKGAYNTAQYDGAMGVKIEYPQDLLQELWATLQGYANL